MEGAHEELEDIESASSDSFIDDIDNESLASEHDDGMHPEATLTEEEIEGLIAEFMDVESKAAEGQEALEKEALAKLENEVREELAQTLHGDDLETAVAEEISIYIEGWETKLDELETESAYLLEQLDGAGVSLPSLYNLIESQAPSVCCTEAWKKRIHWVGSEVNSELTESISGAEKHLQTLRPVRRRHGKLLEEGASGFLQSKFAIGENKEDVAGSSEVDWSSFEKICSEKVDGDEARFGSKHWASVYLASTPQEAAAMGIKFPGLDEVEEISDIDSSPPTNPFIADAIANEREVVLSEEQKKNFRKIREEDDAILDQKLQRHLKQRRQREKHKQDVISKETCSFDQNEGLHFGESHILISDEKISEDRKCLPKDESEALAPNVSLNKFEEERPRCNNSSILPQPASPDSTEPRCLKRSNDGEEPNLFNKKNRTVDLDNDDEVQVQEGLICNMTKLEDPSLSEENVDGSVGSETLLPQSVSEKYQCTACGVVADEVHPHPLLNVIICRDCKSLIEQKMNSKDFDCSECYCGWCGRSSDLISCRSCKTLFCAICVERNIGEEYLSEFQASGWQCCCCSPSLLQHLKVQLEKALVSNGLEVSTSESDPDNSDADVNINISSKRKKKKKIRRILEDAELGEETKRKIAIEKERQERLKSLQVQFSAKSKMMSAASCNVSLPDGASVEVLGDPSTGYIVNVVREKGEEVVKIPPSISAKLKTHQIAGIRFMWENIIQSIGKVRSGDKGLGCILAHTMGLGKTFQVIAFLYTAMRSIDLGLRTALVVLPVNVLHNWRQEFLKWKPLELKPLRVFMIEDVPRDRRAELLAKWRAKGGVFLISYTAFRNLSLGKNARDRYIAREISIALQDGPDILVCDEAHMIKNRRADTTQALKLVKTHRRVALTGSPLQNNLMEYYCMVDFVREGFLGSSHEFRNRFQNPIENGQHTNSTFEDVKIMNQRSHILYEQLKGFVQRMDMNVVKKDLPPKTVFVVAVKLSPLQRKLYKRFLDMHGFKNDKVSSEKIRKSFFAGYQTLAQIWNHPGILQLKKDGEYVRREDEDTFLLDESSSDENIDYNMVGEKPNNANGFPQNKNGDGFFYKDWWNDLLHENTFTELDYSGKMVLLYEILTMCSDVGDKALVFSQSLPTLDLIELYLSRMSRHGKRGKLWRKGKDWYRLDGRTQSSERQKLVERFNDPLNKRVKCTLISTRAGSLGINLHAANRVIIVDGSWNPTHDLQAIYRAWRYGQTKPVFAYRFVAHGTMEEKIYKRQVTKEGLAARVVDRQQVHRTISREEMLHLFEFGDDENPDSLTELGQEKIGHSSNPHTTFQVGSSMKQQEPLSHGSCSSDKLMEKLLNKHHPRWITNYHEHETLLQENEDEKMTKEEQDMAWEVYQRTFKWEEAHRTSLPVEQKPTVAPPALDSNNLAQSKASLRNRTVVRKCTNLSHLLTLRSQGTKLGCSTICGECAQEISWEDLKRDGKI